jgi:hypothetical protein
MVYLASGNAEGEYIPYAITRETGSNDPRPQTKVWDMRFSDLLGEAGMGIIVGCLFVAVFIRSYAGFIWPLGFEKTGYLILVPAAASFMGKALGGVIADRLGPLETAEISLLLSVGLFLLGNGSWVIMGISIMLFNDCS